VPGVIKKVIFVINFHSLKKFLTILVTIGTTSPSVPFGMFHSSSSVTFALSKTYKRNLNLKQFAVKLTTKHCIES
jgi:hypothetical protein